MCITYYMGCIIDKFYPVTTTIQLIHNG